MNRIIAFGLLLMFTLSSCQVVLRSVVEPAYKKDQYDNILIVINAQPESITQLIAEEFSASIRKDRSSYSSLSARVHIDNQVSFGRVFSDNLDNQKLARKIENSNCDLIISIRPISLDLSVNKFVYEAVAIDTENNKEVWGAAIDSVSSMRARKFGKGLGKNLLEKLKEDDIIL